MRDELEIDQGDHATSRNEEVRVGEAKYYPVAALPGSLPEVAIGSESQPTLEIRDQDLLTIRDRLEERGVGVALPPPRRDSDLPTPEILPGTPLSEIVRQLRQQE